jgi:hypothetical protein
MADRRRQTKLRRSRRPDTRDEAAIKEHDDLDKVLEAHLPWTTKLPPTEQKP